MIRPVPRLDIESGCDGFAAGRLDCGDGFCCTLLAKIIDCHTRTESCERASDSCSNALASARNQGRSAREIEHVMPPSLESKR